MGFSLVELLVVLAVILLLAALIIPAVQRAREASRRTLCINNLKQLTLACLEYESTHNCLPPGYIAGTDGVTTVTISPTLKLPVWPDASMSPEFDEWYLSDNWSWHAIILPQLGDPGTGVNTSDSKGTRSNVTGLAVARATFRCPDMGDTSEVFADVGGGSRIMLQFCSYRGNSGTGIKASESLDGVVDNGVMFRDSQIKMRDIRDGESNTLFLTESQLGLWGDGNSAVTRAADDDENGKPDWGPDGRLPSASPSPFDAHFHDVGNNFEFSAGSWHANTVSCSMMDGRAQGLAKTIDFEVLKAISTRAGDERANLP